MITEFNPNRLEKSKTKFSLIKGNKGDSNDYEVLGEETVNYNIVWMVGKNVFTARFPKLEDAVAYIKENSLSVSDMIVTKEVALDLKLI